MNPQQPSRAVPITIALIAIIFVIGIGMYFYSMNRASEIINPNPDTSATTTDQIPTTPSGLVSKVNVFYIALEDAGKSGKAIGCGDSVVPVSVPITPTQAPLRSALEKLFADKKEMYGQSGFRNAVYQSNLKVDSAVVTNGIANVKISGTVMLGGECDDPRFISQIEQTVLQFPSIKSAVITINNKSLASYGSEK